MKNTQQICGAFPSSDNLEAALVMHAYNSTVRRQSQGKLKFKTNLSYLGRSCLEN